MSITIKAIGLLLFSIICIALGSWQDQQLKEEQAIANLKFNSIERTIVHYEEKYVQTGTLGVRERGKPGSGGGVGTLHSPRGFFRTREGATYICELPQRVKAYQNAKLYDEGPVTFWIKKHDNTNTIYQMQAADGRMLLGFNHTVRGYPSSKGMLFLYFLGIMAALVGVGLLILERFKRFG